MSDSALELWEIGNDSCASDAAVADTISEVGVTHVVPFWRTHLVHAKKRWIGMEAIDALSVEHARLSRHGWEMLFVNRQVFLVTPRGDRSRLLDCHYKFIANESLEIHEHAHEPVALCLQPLMVAGVTDHVIAVNKPASVPVHAGGPYYKNTLVYQTEVQLNLQNIRPVHRLDRLTSGLCFLAKTKAAAKLLQYLFSQRRIQKQYFARVKGHFKLSQAHKDTFNITEKKTIAAQETEGTTVFELDAPVYILRGLEKNTYVSNITCSHERKREHEEAKLIVRTLEAMTQFQVVSYDAAGDTTLMLCLPKTGRPHQIRAHLEVLGFPIANDPFHSGHLFESNAYLSSQSNTLHTAFTAAYEPTCLNCNLEITGDRKQPADSLGLAQYQYYHYVKPRITYIWLHAHTYTFDLTNLPEGMVPADCNLSESGDLSCLNRSYTVAGPDWTQATYDASAALSQKLEF
jgi:tRNA pseudouridine synthase 9